MALLGSNVIQSDYPRPLPPPRLLLPLLLLPLEPEDREGGDTDEPRELLPEEDGRAASVLGLDGRAGVALGREEVGRAGRALLPVGRVVDDGRALSAGLRDVPDDGLTV